MTNDHFKWEISVLTDSKIRKQNVIQLEKIDREHKQNYKRYNTNTILIIVGVKDKILDEDALHELDYQISNSVSYKKGEFLRCFA